MPPATSNKFFENGRIEKPLPNGPNTSTVSLSCRRESHWLPLPPSRTAKKRAMSSLVAWWMLKGRGKVKSAQRTIMNWPGLASPVISGQCNCMRWLASARPARLGQPGKILLLETTRATTCFMLTLSPLSPSPFRGRGIYIREAKPLFDSPLIEGASPLLDSPIFQWVEPLRLSSVRLSQTPPGGSWAAVGHYRHEFRWPMSRPPLAMYPAK